MTRTSIDAVYFLMWPTWATELVGNRWHFARRWARRAPVVLVQPTESRPTRARVEPEHRIPNCEILHVAPRSGRVQAAQVAQHMASRGHSRPLFWAYNPDLLVVYAGVPAVARCLHASENYFGQGWFHGVGGELFERRLRASYTISDVIVSVSVGLGELIRRETGLETMVETNGCDFTLYSSGTPDAEFVQRARSFERSAVYAGNVSEKVDFDLLLRCADAHPSTLFAIFGPVAELGPNSLSDWRSLKVRSNVWYGGSVEVERLADIYAAADIGLIPYVQIPLLVDVGFPLKLFEMGAAGLPVVSTELRGLEGLAAAVHVEASSANFVARVGCTSRATEPAEALGELVGLSAANDYDTKFERVAARVASFVSGHPVRREAEAAEAVGADGWARLLAPPSASARLVQVARMVLPAPMRRIVPASVKRLARGAVFREGSG